MGHVTYVTEDGIGIITIDRPSALNALSSQVLNELDSTLDQVDTDAIRILILTGTGERAFVVGADISEMAGFIKEEGRAFGRGGDRILHRLKTFPIPVITAVNGSASGGGCELALSYDARTCSNNAVFGQPEAGLGITPGFGGTQRLVQTVSVGMAKRLLYAAWPIKAEKACRIGLVNVVYLGDGLMTAARRLAGCIAQNAPITVRNCKKAVNDGLQTDMGKTLTMEETLLGDCSETKDQEEGVGAFLEKRKERNFINR